MRHLKLFSLYGIFSFLLFLGSVAAADTDQNIESLRSKIDCTPICGSKFCCVGAEVSIAACVLDGREIAHITGNMERISKPNRAQFDKLCLSKEKVLRSFDQSGARSLDCNMGCCADGGVVRAFTNSAVFEDILSKSPSQHVPLLKEQKEKFDVALKTDDVGYQKFVIQETQRLMNNRLLWIFCCTF